MRVPMRIGWLIVFLPCGLLAAEDPADQADQADSAVSYTRDILPVFQTHCQGCHQPAVVESGGPQLVEQRLHLGLGLAAELSGLIELGSGR